MLSADRHRTDVYEIKRPKGYTLYEFETSKLTNNHTHGTKKEALFSYNKGNFFGLLDFDLTKKDPEMTFRCITIDDEEVYNLTLKRSQLQAKLPSGSGNNPKFNFNYQKKGPHGAPNSIEARVTESSVVFDLKSGFGIGSGKIQLAEGDWPKNIQMRLHLAGLEGFSVSNGKATMSRSDLKIRMLDAKGNPVEGKYLLQPKGPRKPKRIEGYYEVIIPPALLSPEVKELKISWVDFYR